MVVVVVVVVVGYFGWLVGCSLTCCCCYIFVVMLVTFPLTISGGSLKTTDSPVEYLRSQLLQILSVYKGEIEADPEYGVPYILFTARSDFNTDLANLDSILTNLLPQANITVSGTLTESGLATVQINYSYAQTSDLLVATYQL